MIRLAVLAVAAIGAVVLAVSALLAVGWMAVAVIVISAMGLLSGIGWLIGLGMRRFARDPGEPKEEL